MNCPYHENRPRVKTHRNPFDIVGISLTGSRRGFVVRLLSRPVSDVPDIAVPTVRNSTLQAVRTSGDWKVARDDGNDYYIVDQFIVDLFVELGALGRIEFLRELVHERIIVLVAVALIVIAFPTLRFGLDLGASPAAHVLNVIRL